jgi:hypothetical protein
MYIMAPEPISTAYFVNPSHRSVCLYVYPPIVAGKGLGKHVPTTNTDNNRIVGHFVSFAVHVMKGESVGLFVYSP